MHILRTLRPIRARLFLLGFALILLSSLPALGSTWAPSDPPPPFSLHPLTLPDGSPAVVKVRNEGVSAGNTAIRMRPMAVGANHACAILADDRVICWGQNDWAQLGSPVTAYSVPFPLFVQGLQGTPVTLAAGDEHTCVALADGRVQCWGGNANGQLGNGHASFTTHPTPVFVSGLAGKVMDLAAGGWHTCALLEDGRVQCWGANNTGQLGDGTTTDRARATTVSLPGPATWITAGCNHTCALLADGRMYCWGWNPYGQLGDGTTTSSSSPVRVTAVSGRGKTIEAGCSHTCAAYVDPQGHRRLACWGGIGTITRPEGNPVSLLLMRAGSGHTCILTQQHGILCWGRNSSGQLGDGTTQSRRTLAPVLGMERDVFYMTTGAGADFTCAVRDDGMAFCWGSNMWGQMGNGSLVLAPVPRTVFDLDNARDVSAGMGFTCAVSSDQRLLCWGQRFNTSFREDTSAPALLPSLSHVVQVDAGESHSCARLQDGSVRCWGDNDYGQLGDGTTQLSTTPVRVQGLGGNATAVRVGREFSCALRSDGVVRCWGRNRHGQLGNGSTQDAHTPVTVALPASAKAVGLGAQHACAVLTNGDLYCWGANPYGQVGDGTDQDRPQPVRVNLPAKATDVRAGDFHTCALLENGQMWCWGGNSQGQLGVPGAGGESRHPVRVQNLSGAVVALDAGGDSTCAVVNGGVRCWGSNFYGQVGDGTYHMRWTPTQVVGLAAGVRDVSVAWDHVCALSDASSGGRVLCWGSDAFGQLGRHRDVRWTRPVPLGETPPPYLQPNHATGRVGSVFTLVGANFPATPQGHVIINGHPVLTSFTVGQSGQVRFFVDSQGAAPGDYLIVLQAGGKQAAVVLRLTSAGTVYPKEGDGTTVHIPARSAQHIRRMYAPRVIR